MNLDPVIPFFLLGILARLVKSDLRLPEALYEALRPGGFLCLGHSESMSRISSLFTVRKLSDAIVYQRAAT